MNSSRQQLLAAIILALVPVLLLWRVVFLGECFVPAALLQDIAPWANGPIGSKPPWNPLMWDGIGQFYPWRAFASETLRSGYLPLWNPHQFCGTPFVANSQSAIFYPLNLIFEIFPVTRAFGISVLLHLFLTGFFAYRFLISPTMNRSHPAALLGAVAWQTSTWQIAWLALPTFLSVSAWLPLALLLIDNLIAKRSTISAAKVGLCLGVMLLAGHLQIALYSLLLIAAYGISRAVSVGGWPSLVPLLPKAGIAVLLLFAIAAPQLMPSIELSRMSHRAGGHISWSGYQDYLKLSVPAIHLATLIIPNFFGNPTNGTYWGFTNYAENACFVGILPLLLLLIAVVTTWRADWSTRFFGLAAAASLLMALGTPLDAVLYFGIPGFAQSGSPGRVLVLWSLCAAILASRGADALLRGVAGWTPAKALGTGVALLGLISVLTIGYTGWWVIHSYGISALQANLSACGDLWRACTAVLLTVVIIVAIRIRKQMSPTACISILVVVVAAEMLTAGGSYNRSSNVADIYPHTPGINFLMAHAGFERIMPLNRTWSTDAAKPPHAILPPNAATVYGLFDTQGYDSLQTGQYAAFAYELNGHTGPAPQENGNIIFTNGAFSPLANLAAARYLVALHPLPTMGTGLILAKQDGGMFIYENTQALARVRATPPQTIGSVESPAPTRLHILVNSIPGANELTVADQWYPGWQAEANGRERPVERASGIFRGIHWVQEATGGVTHTNVQLRYEPESVRVGLYCLCLALAGMASIAAKAASGTRLRNSHCGL